MVNDKPKQGGFVIESTKARPGDDDPTKLMVREEGKGAHPMPKADATVRGVAPGKSVEIKSGPRASVESAADTKADSSIRKAARSAHRANRVIVIILVLLAVAAAAAAGLYFGGLLG